MYAYAFCPLEFRLYTTRDENIVSTWTFPNTYDMYLVHMEVLLYVRHTHIICIRPSRKGKMVERFVMRKNSDPRPATSRTSRNREAWAGMYVCILHVKVTHRPNKIVAGLIPPQEEQYTSDFGERIEMPMQHKSAANSILLRATCS